MVFNILCWKKFEAVLFKVQKYDLIPKTRKSTWTGISHLCLLSGCYEICGAVEFLLHHREGTRHTFTSNSQRRTIKIFSTLDRNIIFKLYFILFFKIYLFGRFQAISNSAQGGVLGSAHGTMKDQGLKLGLLYTNQHFDLFPWPLVFNN